MDACGVREGPGEQPGGCVRPGQSDGVGRDGQARTGRLEDGLDAHPLARDVLGGRVGWEADELGGPDRDGVERLQVEPERMVAADGDANHGSGPRNAERQGGVRGRERFAVVGRAAGQAAATELDAGRVGAQGGAHRAAEQRVPRHVGRPLIGAPERAQVGQLVGVQERQVGLAHDGRVGEPHVDHADTNRRTRSSARSSLRTAGRPSSMYQSSVASGWGPTAATQPAPKRLSTAAGSPLV